MEALRGAACVRVVASRVGDAATSSALGDRGRSVSFSSTAVCGGPFRKQVTSAAWKRKPVEGSRGCTCVVAAAAATDAFVAMSGTLYSVLGVELAGSFSDIKSAYKQMARRYHPDVCPPDDRDACTQRFLEVRHAYEILSDPEKRAEYDFGLMHPSFAQALGNSSTSSWGRSRRTQGSEGASDAWRFQWEAQLSRLRRDSEVKSTPVSTSASWGARMRREKGEL